MPPIHGFSSLEFTSRQADSRFTILAISAPAGMGSIAAHSNVLRAMLGVPHQSITDGLPHTHRF
jgi:hypothetical protein